MAITRPEASDTTGTLGDCHRRIERFLEILIRIASLDASAPLGKGEREALEKALDYFRSSAPKHTADEEVSLFPRLRGSGSALAALKCLGELEDDHKTAARDHDLIDALGRQWLEAGAIASDKLDQLRQALARLSNMYRQHIAVEDQELFPLAARVLVPEQLAEVGQEMAERRGVPYART